MIKGTVGSPIAWYFPEKSAQTVAISARAKEEHKQTKLDKMKLIDRMLTSLSKLKDICRDLCE